MKTIDQGIDAIIAAVGLNDAEIASRKAFLEFTQADIEQLKTLHESLTDISQDFSKKFYDHMLSFSETRSFVQDESTLNRLQQSQARYFNSLTAGNYGSDYIRNRLRVGLIHHRIGLGVQWYLGAYAKYLIELLPEIWRRMHDEPARFQASVKSLLKIVLLDIGLAIDTYIHAERQSLLAIKKCSELIFETIPDGLVILNSHFNVVSTNRAFLSRFGLTEANVGGCALLTMIDAECLETALAQVRDTGISPKEILCDMALAGSDSRLPVRITLTGITLPEEEEDGYLIAIEDLSEQDHLQQALRESEASLLRAQEVAHIGSWEFNYKDGTLIWSPQVYRIFNLPLKSTVTYEMFLNCIPVEDREMVARSWQAAIQGHPYKIQHRIFFNSEIRWVEERAQIEFDSSGDPFKANGTVQDVTEQKVAELKIEHLAFYDALTGLPNRSLFMDRLKQKIASAERHRCQFSLLFIDLDRFKEVNDSLGHDVGDRILDEVANRYRLAIRGEETLARLSGDEFVMLASGSVDAVVHIVERFTRVLTEPIVINDQKFTLSASIGIAVFPEDGRNSEDLLKHADIAMYRAKGKRIGYCFYCPEMGERLARELDIAQRLKAAISDNRLQLHYQPQIHLPSGRLIGAEVLTRWHDSEWGNVSPAEFIPVAEDRGLITSLGEWVLFETCHQIRKWQGNANLFPIKMAVNVAAQQFEDDNFIDRVLRISRESGICPSKIELELTESSMMREPERAIEVAHALVSAGFVLSIDDFGTGYSSLTYLKRFPVHKLKIDISFVKDMLTDKNDYAIVNTIIAMGRNMGIETLAEGIETVDQAYALRRLGCNLGQGYYFGHPESVEGFEKKWLAGRFDA